MKKILITSAIFVLVIPFFQHFILEFLDKNIDDIKVGAILATFIIFFTPSLFLGMITPIILKIKLKILETVGKTSGKIHAICTIGGIFGTFFGGFVLIPSMGITSIIFILASVLAILALFVDFKLKNIKTFFVALIICIAIISGCIYTNINNSNSNLIIEGNKKITANYDTQYGHVIISNSKYNGHDIRLLDIDSGHESATYIEEDMIYELVFEYTKYYDLMFKANIDINNVLLIGGAGYSYPKYYISHYDNKKIDVVEIDDGVTEIAKKFFYLDKLIIDYDLDNNDRLKIITDDGRVYLNNNKKQYDAILNDAFSGSSPAKTLTTIQNANNIKKSLIDNGVYLTNIISSLDGENSKFIKAEVNTLKRVFKNVYIVPCKSTSNIDLVQNNMVIATDDELKLENTYDLDISANEIILTDDYCPVDTLIPIF